jgi:hypothetical protein
MRLVYTLGAATKTVFADPKGSSLLTAEVPCVGGGLGFHAHVRAATPGKEQRLLHAGAGTGMPCRLQMVLNWAVFSSRVWNRTMANFLIQDVLDHPALDMEGNASHAALVEALYRVAV